MRIVSIPNFFDTCHHTAHSISHHIHTICKRAELMSKTHKNGLLKKNQHKSPIIRIFEKIRTCTDKSVEWEHWAYSTCNSTPTVKKSSRCTVSTATENFTCKVCTKFTCLWIDRNANYDKLKIYSTNTHYCCYVSDSKCTIFFHNLCDHVDFGGRRGRAATVGYQLCWRCVIHIHSLKLLHHLSKHPFRCFTAHSSPYACWSVVLVYVASPAYWIQVYKIVTQSTRTHLARH